jgi:phosphopantothenoylcysteine decarboxylase/phosphopantothenate--cysteine ligase
MRVVLGVSGGVAAYKAAELVRRLQQEHLNVQVVMTRHAQEFVTPLTFAALTGQKVITGMFDGDAPANVDSAVEHIGVAQSLDVLVIAPATANTLAKMARGVADDFLTTLYLATTAPVIVAPAMNVNMWEHPATRKNVEILRERGVRVVSPDEGYLACGMTGKGRLAGVEAIAQAVMATLGIRHDLEGETVLVTAGPTYEDIDPVRYLTNRSSGKMGFAVAAASARRGARVILVSGPTGLDAPERVERIDVRSAEEMHRAVLANLSVATIVVMAAAVADYRPVYSHDEKIKRESNRLTLELEPTPDILADISKMRGSRTLVGFAAETGNLADNARKKLSAKSVDMIVANDVTAEGAGFDVDTNVVTLYLRDGNEKSLPQMSKLDVADRILDTVIDMRRGKPVSATPSAEMNPRAVS